MTLHDQILAKLAELRATAEAAKHGGEGRWRQTDPDRETGRIEDERGETVVYDEGSPSGWEAEHIATWNPAFSLRWIEWAETLASEHPMTDDGHGFTYCPECTAGPYPCNEILRLVRVLDLPDQNDRSAT